MATQPYYLNTLDQLESEAINPSRNGVILALGPYNQLEPGEQAEQVPVGFRTIGDNYAS